MLHFASMIKKIDEIEYASLLYDFYGGLLDENKRDIMSLYHDENLSLSEISKEIGQSRQAVHYNLKKAESELKKFDEVLNLIPTYLNNIERANIINKHIREILSTEELKDISKNNLEDIICIIDEMVD